MKILLFGRTGWIGYKLYALLKDHEVVVAKSRLDSFCELQKELENNKDVTHILMAAGLTGKPNVDWCEDHKDEVISVNVIGTSIVAKFCYNNDIHFTYLGSGCIYEYDKEHTYNSKGFTEEDKPNFDGSFYSFTKAMIQDIIKEYNGLILRLRMPITPDLYPKNFITKITKYKKVINIPNSMSILNDLLPLVPKMMTKELVGVYNFTNPGVISHNQILDLYKKYIDKSLTYENFTIEEQDKILKAKRSNNCLDVSKLLNEFSVPHIQESIIGVFQQMKH